VRVSDEDLYRCVVEDATGQQWNDTDFLSVNGLSAAFIHCLIYTRAEVLMASCSPGAKSDI